MSEILYTFIVPNINLSINDSGNTPNVSINNTNDLPNLSITQSGDTINVSIEQSGNPPNVNIYDYFLHGDSHLKGGVDQIDHNLLFGVQGGESGNYYHLNSGEYFGLVTGDVIRPADTGAFYAASNPSGYITGIDLSSYATQDYVTGISGNLQGQITALDNQTGNYYLDSNPSGYITGIDLSDYAQTGYVVQISGNLQDAIDLLDGQTGNYYLNTNPSGYITGISNIVYTTGNQTINGQKEFSDNSLFDKNIRVSGNITGYAAYLNKVSFDTTYTGVIQEGELQWNNTDGTLDLGMDGGDIIMQLGQEMFTKVRNQSGSTITNGSVVYFNGRSGNRPLIRLAKSDSDTTSRVAGVATQDISSPSDGFITTVGYVRGIKTNYSGTGIWGSTWAEGDILYVSKTVAGQLTNVEPSVPHHSDIVGTVGIVHNNLGSILITINRHHTLEGLVDINGTPLTTNGQFPSWNQVSGYFDFDKNINDYYLKTNPSGYITGFNSGDYSTISFSTGISGYLQGQISELSGETGNYYLNSNPSGYITGVDELSFSYLLSTGVEQTGVLFTRPFSSTPRVFASLLLPSDTGYLVGVKAITTTGYIATFSDVIAETGIYLQTFASNL